MSVHVSLIAFVPSLFPLGACLNGGYLDTVTRRPNRRRHDLRSDPRPSLDASPQPAGSRQQPGRTGLAIIPQPLVAGLAADAESAAGLGKGGACRAGELNEGVFLFQREVIRSRHRPHSLCRRCPDPMPDTAPVVGRRTPSHPAAGGEGGGEEAVGA